jgi:putative DNA-invertase from lambdoid prophage Rac
MAAAAEAQGEAHEEGAEGRYRTRQGHRPHRYRGRKPSFDRAQLEIIRDMLAQDASPAAIAEAAGVSRQVVYRVQDDPAKGGSDVGRVGDVD